MFAQMNKAFGVNTKDLCDEQWKINFMNELIDAIHKTADFRLCPEEAKDMLLFIASDCQFNFSRN